MFTSGHDANAADGPCGPCGTARFNCHCGLDVGPDTVMNDVRSGSIKSTIGVITGYGPGGPWEPIGICRYSVPYQM